MMNKKTTYLFYTIISLFTLLFIQVIYLQNNNSMTKEMKKAKIEFVQLVQLPDLAISTEATYIRHRSLADIFSIYKDDGNLREYFPSTFTYSHSQGYK